MTVFEGVSRTPEALKRNIGAAREVLNSGACPDAPETVARYFHSYLDFAGRDALDASRGGWVEILRRPCLVQAGIVQPLR